VAVIFDAEGGKGVRNHFDSSARDGRIRTKEFWRAALERLGKVPILTSSLQARMRPFAGPHLASYHVFR
jgi:hypothetical protein